MSTRFEGEPFARMVVTGSAAAVAASSVSRMGERLRNAWRAASPRDSRRRDGLEKAVAAVPPGLEYPKLRRLVPTASTARTSAVSDVSVRPDSNPSAPGLSARMTRR